MNLDSAIIPHKMIKHQKKIFILTYEADPILEQLKNVI